MLSNEFCQMLARNKIFSIWNDGKRSIRAGLKLSAFALVTLPVHVKSKFCYKTCEILYIWGPRVLGIPRCSF